MGLYLIENIYKMCESVHLSMGLYLIENIYKMCESVPIHCLPCRRQFQQDNGPVTWQGITLLDRGEAPREV